MGHYNGNIWISDGTEKMELIQQINTSSVLNSFCKKMAACDNPECVCTKCYARQFENYRKGLTEKFMENDEMLSSHILDEWELPRFSYREIIRFNAYGELINATHFLNVVKIAESNPFTKMALWSKRKDLIQKCIRKYGIVIPKNLTMVYSNPMIDNPINRIPKGFHIVFNVFSADYALANNIRISCGVKHCIHCCNCYGGKCKTDGTMVTECVVNEILKRQQKRFLNGGGVIW